LRWNRAWRLLFTAVLLLQAGVSRADQVTLTNGDRLSGNVVNKETEFLILAMPYLGEVKVRWSEVTRVFTDKDVKLFLDDGTMVRGRLETVTDGTAVVHTGVEPPGAPVDLKRIVFINPAPDVSGEGVKYLGRINLGYSASRGNSEIETLYVDGEAVARTRNNRFTAGGKSRRSTDHETESESNWLFGIKWDHFLTRRWYTYANTNFENDQFKDIRLRTTAGGGTGYQFFEGEKTNLSLEGGLTYVNTDFLVAEDESYPAVRWALKFDHFLFNSRSQFFHTDEIYAAVAGSNSAFVRSQTGLRFPLIYRITGTLQYNLDWENSPSPDRVSTDRTLLFTLGYSW
jgi:putative salt-induced outer membrane protein YdiY